jgi:HSP20 family protein
MGIRKRDMSLAPLGYWGPVSIMREMERMFDEMSRGFPYVSMEPVGTRMPAVDIRDEEKQYTVEAELPGLSKEDVSLEMDEESLVIKADKETSNEDKSEGYVRRERGKMSYYRHISLPADVDVAQVSAKMEDGVLKVVLPKKEKAESGKKKLDIQ